MKITDTKKIDTKIIDVEQLSLKNERTSILDECIAPAAICLKEGGLVAFPTETVYGLGADALNVQAAKRIYEAKGRPSDNPLIVHIAKTADMERLALVNEKARLLAESFWPGPLTVILPKKDIVPYETTGGLDTVAIRMPSHPAAISLIEQSGIFVAAPSANSSGRPSPTRAGHVIEDMEGKIEYIINGGAVGIGIESTIIDLSTDRPVILRPGFITKSMLETIIGEVEMDAALETTAYDVKPKAPGMKYTHYAPKGELTLVEKNLSVDKIDHDVISKIRELTEEKMSQGYRVGIMASAETKEQYEGCCDVLICVGEREQRGTIAAGLYKALREFDDAEVDYIYAESFRGDELSYAIMNRLLKAAGHRIVRV